MSRYFLRCPGCLEITAVDVDRLPIEFGAVQIACGICDTRLESMGRVHADHLVVDTMQCKCDDRCTSARGPICTCSCNGKNHGAGWTAYINVTVRVGPLPTLAPSSLQRRAAALARFQEYRQVRERLQAERNAIADRRRAGEFLPRPTWDRMNALDRILSSTHKARLHSSRMKTLRTALPPAALVSTTAPAEFESRAHCDTLF